MSKHGKHTGMKESMVSNSGRTSTGKTGYGTQGGDQISVAKNPALSAKNSGPEKTVGQNAPKV